MWELICFFFPSFITGVENQYFLVDVVFMNRCNYLTVSQAILASLHSNDLDLNDAWAVVTNNAAYCLKAYREVLQGQCPCYLPLPHHKSGGWDLSALQIFIWCYLTCHMDEICVRRWVAFLVNKEAVQAKVPPEAVCTRWNSWFEAIKYHAEHVHLYRQFFFQRSQQAWQSRTSSASWKQRRRCRPSLSS